MRFRRLGNAGPEISVVGYGAWEAGGDMWGADVGDEAVVATMQAALDAGINWIDTAEAYGGGRSEQLVAEATRERSDALVFTKVAPFESGTRPSEIRRAAEGSLRRLRRDHLDLYQLHWPDEERVPVEQSWAEMCKLRDEGIARSVGVSNFDRRLIERCLQIGRVDSVQNQFSLLHDDDRVDLLPWLSENGIGYLAYGPLAFGLLSGKLTLDTRFDADDWRSGRRWQLDYYKELFAPRRFEENLAKVEQLRPIAEQLGFDIATLSLCAALETTGVTAVIVGSRRVAHTRANAGAGDATLDAATMSRVWSIFSPEPSSR